MFVHLLQKKHDLLDKGGQIAPLWRVDHEFVAGLPLCEGTYAEAGLRMVRDVIDRNVIGRTQIDEYIPTLTHKFGNLRSRWY